MLAKVIFLKNMCFEKFCYFTEQESQLNSKNLQKKRNIICR